MHNNSHICPTSPFFFSLCTQLNVPAININRPSTILWPSRQQSHSTSGFLSAQNTQESVMFAAAAAFQALTFCTSHTQHAFWDFPQGEDHRLFNTWWGALDITPSESVGLTQQLINQKWQQTEPMKHGSFVFWQNSSREWGGFFEFFFPDFQGAFFHPFELADFFALRVSFRNPVSNPLQPGQADLVCSKCFNVISVISRDVLISQNLHLPHNGNGSESCNSRQGEKCKSVLHQQEFSYHKSTTRKGWNYHCGQLNESFSQEAEKL